MAATRLPVVEGDRPPNEAAAPDREDVVRAGVLAALGRPGQLLRVVVVPLWGDHFRVNVVTGADPTLARIPHSYFLAADARGNVTAATPPITRLY
jgi:hypothetical protein